MTVSFLENAILTGINMKIGIIITDISVMISMEPIMAQKTN